MEPVGPIFVVLNSVAAAVLVQAGLYKIAVPDPLRRALTELAPGRFAALGNGTVRAVAAVEIVVGAALLVPAARVAGAVAAAVLGAAFAVLGVAGWMRRSVAPCGCLGAAGSRSLGPTNVALGLALVLFGAVSAVAQPAVAGRWGPVLTAFFLLALSVWMNRELALKVLRGRAAARMGDG